MAYSIIPKIRKDGTLRLLDGTSSPVELIVAYEEGNLTFDVPGDDQILIRDRSALSCIRAGDSQPITGSFSFYFRDFTDSEVGSVRDFITKQNAYSANISTGATGIPYMDAYAIDIKYQINSALDGNTTSDSFAQISKAICSYSWAEGDPGTFTISFTAYGDVAYTAGS